MNFPIRYPEILQLIDQLDPQAYALTRNYYKANTSRLSPYLSRGVINLVQVKNRIREKYSWTQCSKFIYELAWREYFQRTWWRLGDGIFQDIKPHEPGLFEKGMMEAICTGTTGIIAIDEQVSTLVREGYIHNHARMHIASLNCNVGKTHWYPASRWMYYYLLDGDLASNALSWQWVAGTFSSKKYWFNQDNLNHFSGINQPGTFIDVPYEELNTLKIPERFGSRVELNLATQLPAKKNPVLNSKLPLLLYNSYNLDPEWRAGIAANRVLLLEPSHFSKYPVALNVSDFILGLAANIKDIQVFAGELNELASLDAFPEIYSKAHPAFTHYPGEKDPIPLMFPEALLGNSFSSFWNSCLQTMRLSV